MSRPREFDETAVMERAIEVFWAKGFAATSVQDLVEATGLQRGSLYGAFGDKRTLYLTALDAYMASGLRFLQDTLGSSEDPVEGVREFIRSVGVRCAGEDKALGCLVGNTCSELAAQDPGIRERVAEFMATTRTEIAEALRRAQELGIFDRDRSPDAVATSIQCTLQGLTLLGKTHPEPEVIDQVVDEMLRALS